MNKKNTNMQLQANDDPQPIFLKNPQRKKIIVILGDPRKPDPLKPSSVFDDDDIDTVNQLKGSLKYSKKYQFSYLDNHDSLLADLVKAKKRVDFVLNLCDEGFGNNASKELHIPALLEILNIPYTGANPQCLAFCYDKSLVRGVAREMKIPIPEGFFIKSKGQRLPRNISFPVIVKPNFGDGSYGITQKSVVKNRFELMRAIDEMKKKFGSNKPVIVEEFLKGKDLTIGMIGNQGAKYTALPILEEDYSKLPKKLPRVCGYEAKWLPESPYWQIKSIPAVLSQETIRKIKAWSKKLFERLGCRDYARFDWRLDKNGNPKLLEVNPNPGWCWDGHLAKMLKIAGVSYNKMLGLILDTAQKRFEK